MFLLAKTTDYFFRMKNHKYSCSSLCAALLFTLLFVQPARAIDPNDPAQEFLIAYQNFQQAERLERAGKQNEAITKYKYAEGILKALNSKHPDWQQPVVDYRLHKVRDSLARLSGTMPVSVVENEESVENNEPPSSPTFSNEAQKDGYPNKDGEHPLEGVPSISITPPAAPKNLSDKQIADLQTALKKTELELQKARQELTDKTKELDHSKVVIVDIKSQLEKTERQVTDLKTDLSKAHVLGAQREDLLQKSVQILENKVDNLLADQEVVLEENKHLQDHLNQASASLTAGIGIKKQLEELELQVTQEKNNTALLEQQLTTLQKEHNSTKALNSSLKKQLLEAAASLSEAEKQAKEASALHLQIDKLRTADTALAKEISSMKREQQQSADLLKEATEARSVLEQSHQHLLAEAQNKSQTAQREYESLKKRKLEVEEQLMEANKKIKSFEDLLSHKASLEEEMIGCKKQLQQTSLQLIDQEKKIAELQKTEPEKDRCLIEKEKELSEARLNSEKLQKELVSATQKLSAVQAEVQLRDDRYSELHIQLDQKNKELFTLKNKSEPKEQEQSAVAENQLLRGIVIRELKTEAKREQIKKLILDDLEKLKVNSVTLSNQLQKLTKPIKLTQEEKALFKNTPLLSPLASTTQEESDDFLMLSSAASKKDDSSQGKLESGDVSLSEVSKPQENPKSKSIQQPYPSISSDPEKNKTQISQKHHELITTAKEQFEHHNYFEAEKKFQDAVAISPNDYLTLANLGVVEFQLSKMSEAESVLKKAVSIDGKKSFALTTLGIIEYRQEKIGEAERDLRKAIAINDQDFTAHNYLGIVLAASQKGKAGESEIIRALEINPQYADAHFNLAVIYATSKPPAKEMAKTHYQKAIALGAPVDSSLEKLLN